MGGVVKSILKKSEWYRINNDWFTDKFYKKIESVNSPELRKGKEK